MNKYEKIQFELRQNPKLWAVTGVAGFIGSNLLEALLRLGQKVVGLDNFSTGHQRNLDEVRQSVNTLEWSRFIFIHGDICNIADCRTALTAFGQPVDFVLHQAALGSVPRSIADPISTNRSNIDGFLNILVAARDFNVKRFVFAASSSTYGDHPSLPKVEDQIGKPLSPYAVTKYVNELYADVFARTYGLDYNGLRYFNVFGRRQDPNGPYAAVIPKWISAILANEEVLINGDGETSRDFCYVENAVQANILAATATDIDAVNQIYNVAVGEQTSLNRLYASLCEYISELVPALNIPKPLYREFRQGDVRHSLASVAKAASRLGYDPQYNVGLGLKEVMPWYISYLSGGRFGT